MLKKYLVDNNNINDTNLKWILKMYTADNDVDLERMLKKYQVDNASHTNCNESVICKHKGCQILPFRLIHQLVNNNRNKDLNKLLLILWSACQAVLLLFLSIFQAITVIFKMSQLVCQVVRNNISFDDYDDDYSNTRFLKGYMTDNNNNNTVNIKLEWILKKYQVDNVAKLDQIL